MKLLVFGSGLMGPAAAFNALADDNVSGVTICDLSREQLDGAEARLAGAPGAEKLSTLQLDLRDRARAAQTLAGFDVALAALPRPAVPFAVQAAVDSGTPLIDLSSPPQEQAAALIQLVQDSGALVIPGCGLEPGLTEIVARHLAEKLDRVEEVHIKCGGVPSAPTPPLGYKIVFGGRRMPLRAADARVARDGKLVAVPRYSGVEPVSFPGVGDLEAWHEGFMPHLLDLDALRDITYGTQKTVRWPGYADKVTVLKQLGLLSTEPIDVHGSRVAPKDVLDALLYPHVKMQPEDRDITIFRVDVSGQKNGRPCRYRVQMVDRYDETLGFTSMARTTAMTGAIVARMVGDGALQAQGWVHPEQVITGRLFDRLVSALAAIDIVFDMTVEETTPLATG